jgi:hypothetical protein
MQKPLKILDNLKTIWKLFRELVAEKAHKPSYSLKSDGITFENSNEQIVQVFTNIASNIKEPFLESLKREMASQFSIILGAK